jgi:hypothetical protein
MALIAWRTAAELTQLGLRAHNLLTQWGLRVLITRGGTAVYIYESLAGATLLQQMANFGSFHKLYFWPTAEGPKANRN